MNKLNLYHNHLHSHVGFIGNAELIVIVLYLHTWGCMYTSTFDKDYLENIRKYVCIYISQNHLSKFEVICACKNFHVNLCFRKERTCRNKLSQLSEFNKNVVDTFNRANRGSWAWVVSLVTIIKPVALN